MIFESPRWLFALLALPIIAAAEMWLTSRDRDRLARLVARPLWGRVVRRPHERWRWIRLSLLLLGAAEADQWLLAAVLMVILAVTGVMLMFVYTPSPDQAYNDIIALQTNVWFGQLVRNLHHFALPEKEEEHPFGHGRLEMIGAIVIGTLLTGLGAGDFGVVEYGTPSGTKTCSRWDRLRYQG